MKFNQNGNNNAPLGWLFALPLALALATHGLIHLMYISPVGPDLGFNGDSWLPAAISGATVPALISVIILGNCFSALGLLRIPVLRSYVVESAIIGNIASLVLFTVMIPGLVPDVFAHIYGIITSIVLIIGAVYHSQTRAAFARVLPKFLSRRMGVTA
ncbi:MAG TPA: hypothetical protein VLH13_05170 [Methanomassiliicoccales archaeon]|nr:hypothetical protein [Methanomassiliicoccales archaeon]